MFSFFKSNCRSFTDIFNNYSDDDFCKPRINESLKSSTICYKKVIELKNITNIKYVPVQKKKTLIKVPAKSTQSNGLFSPTITTYEFVEQDEVVHHDCLRNINHRGENINNLIKSKLSQIENEKYEVICSSSIYIDDKIQFDFNTLDSNKHYNIDLKYKITFMNNKFHIVFFVNNIQEIIIQHKNTLPFDEDTDPV
jgi:hypothetical protein